MSHMHPVLLLTLLYTATSVRSGTPYGDPLYFPLQPGAAVIISNYQGDITVEGWDSELVSVSYRSREQDGGARVDIVHDDGEVLICHVVREGSGLSGVVPEVDFQVKVPKDMDLRIITETFMGDIRMECVRCSSLVEVVSGSAVLSSIEGDLTVNLVSGEIELIDTPGLRMVSIVEGSLKLSVDSLYRDVEINSVQGYIEIEIPEGVRVAASTISGVLEVRGCRTERGLLGSSAVCGEGERTIHVESFSGEIRVLTR